MLQTIANLWARRNSREQLLAVTVACLAGGFLILIAARSAWMTLDGLNREIDRLSNDLVNYNYQLARRKSVDARFDAVASQHSSAWSESEIRDRLRQEIYRLANRIPPGLDENGIPLSTNGEGGTLVAIPQLGQGRLEEGGAGYREYQISVHIPVAPIADMLAYLERLQGSPQSLRLDRIDLRRDPSRSEVSADLDITRIVVDTTDVSPDAMASSIQESDLDITDWRLEGCEAWVDGNGTLVLHANSPMARAWPELDLGAHTTCDLRLALETTGLTHITVATDGNALPGGDPVYVKPDDGTTDIIIRFTPPEEPTARAALQAPLITLETAETSLTLHRLTLDQVDRL